MKYKRWLIKNNFGLLRDTQVSILQQKVNGLKRYSNKDKFINVVRQGDILLTNGKNAEGSLGHAAIMATDNFVLDMPGYNKTTISMHNRDVSNNRRIIKQIWFDQYSFHWIYVYRYPDSVVADAAARWAYRNYYNPTDGPTKTVDIKYQLTWNILSKNPSYCSKLVLHAYYFGTNATVREKLCNYELIFPTDLHKYFRKSLKNIGRY